MTRHRTTSNVWAAATRSAVFTVLLAATISAAQAGDGPTALWTIGVADNSCAEFALAPNGFAKFGTDAAFLVGGSSPNPDWPYVLPGPSDAWAGSRAHAASAAFAMAEPIPKGLYRLVVDLADTHESNPPTLSVALNGHATTVQTPAGAGGGTINGDLSGAREHVFDVTFDSNDLKAGTNEIVVTATEGSWLLFDCLRFEGPAGAKLGEVEEAILLSEAVLLPTLTEHDGAFFQTVRQTVRRTGAAVEATLRLEGAADVAVTLQSGQQTVDIPLPEVAAPCVRALTLESGGQTVATREVALRPTRRWIVYLLPHSHVDIGYTHLQTEVEEKQCGYLELSAAWAKQTEGGPDGSQFKWNSEVLWAVDRYLKKASPKQREAFLDAVRRGWIGLDALYGNELTALCRPEELLELLGCARRLRETYDVPIEAAMISDVPGYTWGLIPAMAQSGIKYFSIGPNVGWRIGLTRTAWSDRPFYWVSPSGREKVLCWMAGEGYSWFHGGPLRDGGRILDYVRRLEDGDYPYDIAYGRYNIGGDNGPPDNGLTTFVAEWNTTYAYPKLIVATTSEMFREFERRYGDVVPAVTGDFTPYWEDGAASSARETAMNREAAERLVQAETLFALLEPAAYPARAFQDAWRNAILYDEHTWGAHNSISEPEIPFVKGQWAIKQAFALEADRQSRALFDKALKSAAASPDIVNTVRVFNTCSWPRTGPVALAADAKTPGAAVCDAEGRPVPSQRLSTGELVFLAADVPALGAAVYRIESGEASAQGGAGAEGFRLWNERVALIVDEQTGAVASLEDQRGGRDFANREGGLGLNDYLYVAGRDPTAPQRSGPVTVRVKESGPVVASIEIESSAPGCRSLTREIQAVAGLDYVEMATTLDKENVYEQEAVHLAFPFAVPEGVLRMDTPWAVVRPEADQMPGSCKNYFTVQRWVDISNQDAGVTWATLDAPLIEVGAITCDPIVVGWKDRIEPSTTIYSYAMNNYWETNYKASQDGPTTFRYAVQVHGRYDAAAAARFGIEQSQPLIAVSAAGDAEAVVPLIEVGPSGVLATALRPLGGKRWLVRLYNASGMPEVAEIRVAKSRTPKVWRATLDGDKVGSKLRASRTAMGRCVHFEMAPFEMATLCVEH